MEILCWILQNSFFLMELILFSNLACLNSYDGQFLLLEQFITNRELYFRGTSCCWSSLASPRNFALFETTTWVEICLSLCKIWIVSLCSLYEIIYMKFDVFYLLKIMKITLLNIKIKEYTLNMIFNCSCDRKLRCIKNWNAQWEIWLVHSHENLIFTFVLLLTFKMVPCGHFCIFLTGLKTIMLTKGPLRGGLQKFWRIWRFVGWFVGFCAL